MTWAAEQNAITARWDAACPITSTRRAYDAFNAPAFTPPAIDTANPANAVWTRLAIVTLPRTARPFGIGSAAHRYHEGLIYQQIFYPRGFGEAFIDATIEAAVLVFHRQSLGSPILVRCRDTEPPARVPPESDDAPFLQVNVTTPYYVIDPTTAES